MKKITKTNTNCAPLPAAVKPRGRILSYIILSVTLIWTAFLSPVALGSPPSGAFSNDRILIRPKAGVSPTSLAPLHAHLGTHVLRIFPRIGNLEVVSLPRGIDVSNATAFFKHSGLVKYAEPDYVVHALLVPNDFHFQNEDQWNLLNVGQYGGTPGADVDATNAWNIQTSASNVVVAVIDTGIRYTHEDLAANMWHNPQENADGYTNDLYGINLTDNGRGNGDPFDDYGHGTHVAGIIGAVGNNGVGVAGICWSVQLMALKFIDTNGNGTISDAITCIDFAASHGAKIVNVSWGADNFASGALWDAFNMLRNEGIIVTAAAGNSANNNDGSDPIYPAVYAQSLDNIISVASVERHDLLSTWSNYGQNSVQIAAPGEAVWSCWNSTDNSYLDISGTSMAAPHIAGACALVWQLYPNLSALQVKNQVLNNVDVLPNLVGVVGTGGRLNLYKTLATSPFPKGQVPTTTIWVDDTLPGGAVASQGGGDSWTVDPWDWVTNNPAPFSGAAAVQSQSETGIHLLSFSGATNTLQVYSGDTLFVYVYLNPTNMPDEIMVSWSDGCWEHRAFWGNDDIPWGEYGTSGCLPMGSLPPAGQWVSLAVPASALELEGASLQGLSLILYNGTATWDYAGRLGQTTSSSTGTTSSTSATSAQ